MNFATQIIKSFQASAVERILVVDDAYDAPELPEQSEGGLLDVLQSPELREHVTAEALPERELVAAVEALRGGEYDDEAVDEAISSVYSAYVDSRAVAIDPGESFASAKGSALEALDPLVELFDRCGDASEIQKVGKGGALRAFRECRHDLVLMDYFLSPRERSARAATKGEADGDRRRSIELLKTILEMAGEETPAVILMSSEDVGECAQRYRSSLKGRVTALRFGFLNKNWIKGRGTELNASGKAADVLMDTSESFEFGRTLEAALHRWKDGAREGLNALHKELREFDLKDFAYLLRFRVYEEGEPFADYLEWFLGESLRAVVDDTVKWNTEEFTQLNERKLTEGIEGAHPVPSTRIASFFGRMRFNLRENRIRKRFALGDLFIASNNRNVRMIISPDCDMVPRGRNRGARRFLTIGGTIHGLVEDQALVSELIFYQTPKAIKWNFKDVMVHDFGDLSEVDVGETKYSYFGTMRAMPAQTIQKGVLADLSRVGLAVPPTVDVSAPVKVYIKRMVDGKPKVSEFEKLEEARAQVFMPRGGKEEQKRALFTSRFMRDLAARLEGMDEGELFPQDRGHRRNWISDPIRVRRAMLREGLKLPGEGIFKSKLLIGDGEGQGKNWLEVVVDVSDEALIQLHTMDPLVH